MAETDLHRCDQCGAIVAPETARCRVTCGRHAVPGTERWNTPFKIRPSRPAEEDEIRRLVIAYFGHDEIFAFGRTLPILDQTNLVADAGGALAGLAACRREDADGILVALTVPPIYQGLGVGSALLSAAIQHLTREGASRVRLATTNDNLPALQLYQRRGFVVEEVRPGEIARLLEQRPGSVPRGFAGIPIRDEIRMVLDLTTA